MNGLAQGARKGFEHPLDKVVIVFATRLDVQVALHGGAQRLEHVLEHFGGCVAHILARKWHVPLKVDTSAKVECTKP